MTDPVSISGAIFVAAGTTLDATGAISLSGTSYDFGLLEGASLLVVGSAIVENASVNGPVSVSAQGLVDIAGTLTASAATLAANAVVTGSGTIAAATIAGAGTLLAVGGDTLAVDAATAAGMHLDVAGGVLVFGQNSVANAVTLDFLPGTGIASGGYPDSLAATGGVFVIDDPQAFNGTISGFAAGDRLVFPGLNGLTVSNVTGTSFEVTGRNSGNASVQYTINAAIPAGTTLFAGPDLAGEAEIGLRAGTIGVAVGGSGFNAGSIDASVGILQRILGLEVLLPVWTSQSLNLTLSVAGGRLSDGTLAAASKLVITAPSPATLDAMLAGLGYTASIATTQDALTVSSNAGLLAGLDATIPITIKAAGTIAGLAGATDAQTALFAGASTLVTQSGAVGAMLVTGAAEFDDMLAVSGIAGTALLIDAGGSAVFGAGSDVTLGSNVTIGNAGAGTLGIETADFVVGAAGATTDLVIAGSSLAAGSAVEVTGGVTVNGSLVVGASAAARLDLSGDLYAVATTIAAAGTLIAGGNAAASLGALVDAGTLVLADDAQALAANLILTGALQLGGTSALAGLSSAVIGGAGQLVVASRAELSASQLNQIGGSITLAGSLQVAGNLLSDSGITLSGGTLIAAAATLGSGGMLSGFGEVSLTGVGAQISAAGGDITASTGLLVIDGNVAMSNGGSIAIAGGAGLDLVDGASGSVVFEGPYSELFINDLAAESAAVSGMVGHDVIDLVGIAPSLVTYASGLISATDGAGHSAGGFALSVAGGPAVRIVADASGGALVTLGDEMACFARGTRLLTPNGYVPVEAFEPGDPIITHAGARRAVRWIGRRAIEAGLRARTDMRPVVVMPGALGPGCPACEVRLSPSHAVFVDGVLVPVMHLVNGATVRRERRIPVTYYHLELDRHDVLIADGLPVESYRDTGNRGQFDQETGLRGRIAKPYAALVTGGPILRRIRRRLHQTAMRVGFKLAHEPKLYALTRDARLPPEMRRQGNKTFARFTVPTDTKRLLLIAQSAAPADIDPDSDDRRELGICVAQPRAKCDRLQLGAGWYQKALGDAGFWMGGSGELLVSPGLTELTLRLAAIAQTWQAPGFERG